MQVVQNEHLRKNGVGGTNFVLDYKRDLQGQANTITGIGSDGQNF